MKIPTFRIDGQVALVTGAGSGMGRGFAIGLASQGADIVITELPGREAAAEETAAEVRALGRRALCVALDVTKVDTIQPVIDSIVKEWDHIDILVNNAGMNIRKLAVDITEADWDPVIDTDLKGAFFVAQAVGKHMISRGKGGKIINTASQAGLVAYEERLTYCSAKSGVISFTRVLAIEWAKDQINVNAIAPTVVRTPFIAKLLENKEVNDNIVGRIPLGRVAEVEDIVGAVMYLASPAANMVTGTTLVIDGGWTIV